MRKASAQFERGQWRLIDSDGCGTGRYEVTRGGSTSGWGNIRPDHVQGSSRCIGHWGWRRKQQKGTAAQEAGAFSITIDGHAWKTTFCRHVDSARDCFRCRGSAACEYSPSGACAAPSSDRWPALLKPAKMSSRLFVALVSLSSTVPFSLPWPVAFLRTASMNILISGCV